MHSICLGNSRTQLRGTVGYAFSCTRSAPTRLRKAEALPRLGPSLTYAACARVEVTDPDDVLAITAEDIFGLD